ncbi:MAG: carboxypeptidase-like regulatory domain-containing protein, partial [Gemmatimonadota bacterium]|nr:carboxypeptidase-like regulatory domain-containing protein [Gemmatimonadota bacterium]
MLSRIVALAALAALSALPAQVEGQTQSTTVTGLVTDEASGEPIAGARVFVFGTVQSSTTRQDGRYRLQL